VIQPPGGEKPERLNQVGQADRGDPQEGFGPDNVAGDQPAATTIEPLDEVREAAGAVIGSLKRLLEATEKVVADPTSFDQAVAGGKGLLDAFTSGFVTESHRSGTDSGEGHDSDS